MTIASIRALCLASSLNALCSIRNEAAQPPPAAPAMSACTTALDCGLTPEAIVVTNASAAASSMLGRLESNVALRSLLAQHHANLDVAIANAAAVSQQAAANGGPEAVIAAQALVNAAMATLEETRLEILEYATDDWSEAALQAFAIWRESAGVNVPPEVRARDHSVDEWKEIEGALRAEQRALRREEIVPDDVATLLANVRADLSVIAASSRLAQHLAEVESLYEECLSDSTP